MVNICLVLVSKKETNGKNINQANDSFNKKQSLCNPIYIKCKRRTSKKKEIFETAKLASFE